MSTYADPLDRFVAEHDEALAELEKLEAAADALSDDGDPVENLATARAAHEFLSTAVREHNENEEHALFPVLGDRAPCEMFVAEHEELRAAEARLRAGIESGDAAETAAAAYLIIDLLRAHIQRENEVLFPMARHLLGPEGLARVARRLQERDATP